MSNKFLRQIMTFIIFGAIVLVCSTASAENIDPDDDGSQYAYSENAGWINFEPSQGEGVTVSDTELTGYAWAENIGWINLSPANGGVVNDGNGNLSGYAWGENVGWINFNPTHSQVVIDTSTGDFSGYAWGENVGWICFSGTATDEDETAYKVKTDWSPGGEDGTPPTTGPGWPGCAIATACYGTPLAEEVKALSAFRDQYLLTNKVGQAFVRFYYRYSPPIADFIRDKEPLKAVVRIGLNPVIWFSRHFVVEGT